MSKRVFKTELDAVNNSLQSQVNNSISKNIVDAKGDIVTASAADTPIRLAVGTNEQRLVVDSATTSGLKYVADTTNYAIGAKGDLLAGTAADTVSALTVGANGETLVADSSASTGLRWTPAPSTGNPVINSAMQIWQRGTSNVTTALAYTADRWQKGSGTHFGVSRQTTSDTTNLPFIQYSARIQRTAGSTTTTGMDFAQNFESINSIFYAGKTVTLSFYARKGADYSSLTSNVSASLYTGTGTDQSIFTGFTGQALNLTASATVSTTWQRFSATATLPSNMTQMAIYVIGTPSGTAGANDWYEVTGFQIDVGSVALPFRTYAATLAGELAACQRYYQKTYQQSAAVPTNSHFLGAVYGNATSTTNDGCYAGVRFPVNMRIAPTVTMYSYTSSQTNRISNSAGTDQGASSAVANGIGESGFGIYNNSGGTITTTNGFIVHYQAVAEL